MSSADKPSVSYFTIWIYLVVLVAIGVALLVAPFSHTLAVILIFSVATVKATLVLRHYMHLKDVPVMLYVMIGLPLILAITMTIIFMPDIGMHQRHIAPPAEHSESH